MLLMFALGTIFGGCLATCVILVLYLNAVNDNRHAYSRWLGRGE